MKQVAEEVTATKLEEIGQQERRRDQFVAFLQGFFGDEDSLVGILLEHCAFLCTHKVPKDVLAALACRGLIECAEGFSCQQASFMNESSSNSAFSQDAKL